MMNTIMNLEYKLDLRYSLDRVLSFKRSLMLVNDVAVQDLLFEINFVYLTTILQQVCT